MTRKSTIGEKFGFQWNHSSLRVKDPEVSVKFYEKNFGMKLIHKYDFNDMGFSLYFLESQRDGQPTSDLLKTNDPMDSEKYLWTLQGTVLELSHNHGSEKDEKFEVNNGNVEPFRGFGHIAFNTPDVFKASEKLEMNGVKFQKKPNEGRMRNLAFVLDPDGYWIEVISRGGDGDRVVEVGREGKEISEEYNLSQTMLRVKDAKKSIFFYVDVMGMTLVNQRVFDDFSLYFLANLPKGVEAPKDPKSREASVFCNSLWSPVLELTHNHGTEENPSFSYHSGNENPKGFGHIAFLTDKLEEACEELENEGVKMKKRPQEGTMRQIAFMFDPDGYWVELVQRGAVIPCSSH